MPSTRQIAVFVHALVIAVSLRLKSAGVLKLASACIKSDCHFLFGVTHQHLCFS